MVFSRVTPLSIGYFAAASACWVEDLAPTWPLWYRALCAVVISGLCDKTRRNGISAVLLTVKKDLRLQALYVREVLQCTCHCHCQVTLAHCISFLLRLLWQNIMNGVAYSYRFILTVLKTGSLKPRCQKGHVLSESLGRILPYLLLAFGDSRQSVAFLGLQLQSFIICLWCRVKSFSLCLCPKFSFLIPVMLD